MRGGDHIVFLPDPLRWGILEIQFVHDHGHLVCQQLSNGRIHHVDPQDAQLAIEFYSQPDRQAA
jgi:hypothetical protein